MTISEGLRTLKTLKDRHKELTTLRDGNAHRNRNYYGSDAGREVVKEPVYDVVKLDALITRIARAMDNLDNAIKAANAATEINFVYDDSVLGQVEATAKA